MLVLTRRIGQEIIIADTIHVTVLGTKGDKVRLGIVAPKEMLVDRSEVHAKRLRNAGAALGLPQKG